MPISEVFNEDNMIGMARYPDGYFDLAIVDPPYGIGDTWSKNRNDRFYNNGALHHYQNESAPGRDFFDELMRVSKQQIVWGGNYYADILPVSNSWIVWHKHNNGDLVHMSEAELAWTSFKKVMKVVRLQWSGAVKCEYTDKVHPHQKPIKLYSWCLNRFATPGMKILDTHVGSQSSRIAAFNMGFDYYGWESDKDYFEAGNKRFREQTAQVQMFTDEDLYFTTPD